MILHVLYHQPAEPLRKLRRKLPGKTFASEPFYQQQLWKGKSGEIYLQAIPIKKKAITPDKRLKDIPANRESEKDCWYQIKSPR